MSINIGPESAFGNALKEFWLKLEKDKGARAELRRCRDIGEVMLTPAYHHFCQRIKPLMAGEHPGWEGRVAAIVGLVAHLKPDHAKTVLAEGKHKERSYAAAFVLPMTDKQGDRPQVSELRFRRLLQRDFEDLYPAMIRLLRMLDGGANLYGLAESVYYWGDRIKKDWAFAYFPRVPEKQSA